MISLQKVNIDFMANRWITFSISIALSLISLFFIATKNLNYGIDFTGGIIIEVKMEQEPDLSSMRSILNSLNIGEVTLQNYSEDKNHVIIRLGLGKSSNQSQAVNLIKEAVDKSFSGTKDYRRIDYVGPQVGRELIINAFYATIFSLIGIMLYIWFRFEWHFGLGLLLALLHDALLALGFMSVTGLEFNLSSIAAILTIIGYSVNDSVVIYDRIRENIKKYPNIKGMELINSSLNSTLSRTIWTVATTLLATLSLILFGGEAIFGFSLLVFFGIIVGTYSSICISAPILLYFGIKKN